MTNQFELLIQEAIAHWQIPGLSVAVASREGFWTQGFGLSDVENDVPATADTVYRIASITKPITATAILQLVEQGKLDLDAPVQEYVPTFPVKSAPITARLLLPHLSGIRDFADNELHNAVHYPYGSVPMSAFLERFQNDPLLHEPGSKFRYSTHGYNLLGAIIEAASGRGYLDYMRENIFRPAGMEHIYPDDAHALIPRRARGYVRDSGQLRNADFTDLSDHLPGGGFCATVGDVVRFGVAWQSGKLLRTETMQTALVRQRTTSGQDTRFGLGWFTWSRGGDTEIAHGGKHHGTSTMLTVRVGTGTVVGTLANLQDISAPYQQSLTQKLADLVDKHGE